MTQKLKKNQLELFNIPFNGQQMICKQKYFISTKGTLEVEYFYFKLYYL